ncbi:MAG: hypothetical protein KatS3mg111_1841 [Pirellulaceae bacterium]|nr:MAG: hypothetical protein KatS3mg111_1841 [Pirellulaceae bacterium]
MPFSSTLSTLYATVLKPRPRFGLSVMVSRGALLIVAFTSGCNYSPMASNQSTRSIEAQETTSSIGIDTPSPFQFDIDALERKYGTLPSRVRFQQAESELGIFHVYQNGAQGRALLVETIGGGCGWLDMDNDGYFDLLVNQGGDPTTDDLNTRPSDRLFRNIAGERFEDISPSARLEEPFYSQGIAIGDFNGDGWDDAYITNVERNTLWLNCGDGTFLEIGEWSGVADPRWGTSAAWGDLDGDQDLDLYVCNYCVYDPKNPQECKDPAGVDTICNPHMLEAWPDACFINQGDGTFRDEAEARGMHGKNGRALGVAIADFTNDGYPDVYVANDTTANFLYINQGDGTFLDEAAVRGCAVDREGNPQGSMGIAVADYDHNGWLDIYCTHYYEESNTLYANLGDHGFIDRTAVAGLHQPTLPFLGFGTVMEDFDADGRFEVFIANGHVDNSRRAADPRMPAQLFSVTNQGNWVDVGVTASRYFHQKFLARGVASCDFDGDGDLDLCVVSENDPTVLLRNVSDRQNWLLLEFIGLDTNRRAIGTRVTIIDDHSPWTTELIGGGSYASSSAPQLFVGLGNSSSEVRLNIRWPDGLVESQTSQVNRAIRLKSPGLP